MGHHLAACPVVSRLACGIFLCWLVRLPLAVWGLCWRDQITQWVVDAWRSVASRGRETHGGRQTRLVTEQNGSEHKLLKNWTCNGLWYSLCCSVYSTVRRLCNCARYDLFNDLLDFCFCNVWFRLISSPFSRFLICILDKCELQWPCKCIH